MHSRLDLLLPLSPLFAALLAGCAQDSCSDFKGGTYNRTVELSPAEYAQWKQGMPPSSTGVATSTTEGSTGGSTGADPTTGADTGMMLTDQEICMMVCAAESGIGEVESCKIAAINASGNIPVECVLPTFCEGRSHACVRSRGGTGTSAATWLARAAHDEAASVHAFLALAEELAAHDAPAELLARITVAVADERRHAALVGALALQHGAELLPVLITPTPTRDLLALAVENMVEGCVRETWAALSAAHQARHAQTPALRDLYHSIAADEAHHAELAWSIHAWLSGQLTSAQRALISAAREAAVRQLQASLAALPDEPGLLALGLPDRATAQHLLTGLDAALWSQAA